MSWTCVSFGAARKSLAIARRWDPGPTFVQLPTISLPRLQNHTSAQSPAKRALWTGRSHLPVLKARFAGVSTPQCGSDRLSTRNYISTEEELGGAEVESDSCEILYAEHIDEDGNVTMKMTSETDWDEQDWAQVEKEAGILPRESVVQTKSQALSPSKENSNSRESSKPEDLDDSLEFEFSFGVSTETSSAMEASNPSIFDVFKTEELDTSIALDSRNGPRLSASADATEERRAPSREISRPASRGIAPPILPKHAPNREKPWMQRRLAMLEAEMERIVVEQTGRNDSWARSGLDVDVVGLSSNMRDLTVFYSEDPYSAEADGRGRVFRVKHSQVKGKQSRGNAVRRRTKEMAAIVRRAIAADMDLKYAPKVHFRATAGVPGSGEGQHQHDQSALDNLFDKIEAERQSDLKST